LLNLYVPVYDSVLVVIAIILTLGALRDLRWGTAGEWTTFVSVITFAVSWVTESVAKAHGIQLLTIMLLILGTMQLLFLYRAEYRRPASQSADRALL
jgi:Flp pilus assembly protein protease CpaA